MEGGEIEKLKMDGITQAKFKMTYVLGGQNESICKKGLQIQCLSGFLGQYHNSHSASNQQVVMCVNEF